MSLSLLVLLQLRLLLVQPSPACGASDASDRLPSVKWLDESQAARVHSLDLRQLGSPPARSRLRLYPETRVLEDTLTVAACHLAFDADPKKRVDSVSLELDSSSKCSVTFGLPKRTLGTPKQEADPTNYEQKVACAGSFKDAVGAISADGVGLFQFKATKALGGRLKCGGSMGATQLTAGPVNFGVFTRPIGSPSWRPASVAQAARNVTLGSELSAGCSVTNSEPGSEFELQLLLNWPGRDELDLVYFVHVRKEQQTATVSWTGEKATMAVNGASVVCRVHRAWGSHREKRARLQVLYMRPAKLFAESMEEPATRNSQVRINLRRGQSFVCTASGFPAPQIEWRANPKVFHVRSATPGAGQLVARTTAKIGRHGVFCIASSNDLRQRSTISALVDVSKAWQLSEAVACIAACALAALAAQRA